MLAQTLDILRRSHLFLSIVALVVFLISLPMGNNLNSGLKQLRDLSTFVTNEAYNLECAHSAASVYHNFWSEAITSQPTDLVVPIPDDVHVGGYALCNKPNQDATLNEYVDFLSAPFKVGVGHLDAKDVYDGLSEVYFSGLQLDGIRIASRTYTEPIQEIDLPIESDTLTLDLYPESLSSNTATQKDSLYLIYDFLWADEGKVSMNHDIRPGRITISHEYTPFEWLKENRQEAEYLARESNGELVYLHHVRPFWQEVSTMNISEAIRYLQARADQQKGNIAVLGLEINVNLLGWGGPLLILALLSNLYVYLLHTKRLVQEEPSAVLHYPWVGFFPDRSSTLIRISSILIIPVLACVAVTIRSAPSSVAASIWSGVVGVVVCVLGVMVLYNLRSLR